MNVYQISASNAVVLANASSLVAQVIQNIAGDSISEQLNGENITRDAIVGLANHHIYRAVVQQSNNGDKK